jgi:hypothetical protein
VDPVLSYYYYPTEKIASFYWHTISFGQQGKLCLAPRERRDLGLTLVTKEKIAHLLELLHANESCPMHQKLMLSHSSLTSAKRSEFMYLSPALGNMVTIIFLSFPSLSAI